MKLSPNNSRAAKAAAVAVGRVAPARGQDGTDGAGRGRRQRAGAVPARGRGQDGTDGAGAGAGEAAAAAASQ